jgi:hypothetical protein
VWVDVPVDVGPIPDGQDDGESLWWRHEGVARTVMRNPDHLASLFWADRDRAELRWLAEPPEGQAAFDEGSAFFDHWTSLITEADTGADVRPPSTGCYWKERTQMANADMKDPKPS